MTKTNRRLKTLLASQNIRSVYPTIFFFFFPAFFIRMKMLGLFRVACVTARNFFRYYARAKVLFFSRLIDY